MKRFLRVVLPLFTGVVLLCTLALPAASANAAIGNQPEAKPCAHGQWCVVPSPNGNENSGLTAVSAVSANDIWAVGGVGNQATGGQTLIEHWNGKNWQIVPSPNPSSSYNHLDGVTAISATNVWAVGFYASPQLVALTLIEHWNGKVWSVVKSPSPAPENNELLSISAVSANNIWTAGFTTTNATDYTLIEHWNGKSWSVVKSPSPGTNDAISGIAAVSASDVWAVGNKNTFAQTLIEHWNGKSWNVVKSPTPGTADALSSVAVVSTHNVWAVGYTTSNGAIQTLVEHWNGKSWNVIKSPNTGNSPSLWAVAAGSANDVWAVGSYGTDTAFNVTLTEHWNGKQWSIVKSPSPGSSFTQFEGVTAVSPTSVWAVGHADSSTLVEYNHC